MDNNKANRIEIIKASAAIAFSAALVALMLCTFFLCNRLLEILAPLLMVILFCVLRFLLDHIPFIRNHRGLKISLQLICAVLAGVLIGL